jgi:hypothetical protein
VTVDPPRIGRARAAVFVMAGMTAVGVVLGVLWAWLAPPVHGVVALNRSGERVHTYLGDEADHFFVAAFLMLGLLWVVSVVTPVLVWQWRAHRGPLMVAALSLGAALSASAAAGVGALLAVMRHPAVDIDTAPVSADDRVYYFTQAPSVFFGPTPWQMAASLLVPAATAALVYALFAVSTARDDLGAYPPVEQPVYPPAVPVVAGVPPEGSAVESGER